MKLIEGNVSGIKTRTVLWFLTFLGFAINYMIRITVNIAIIDMIDINYKSQSAKNLNITDCDIQKDNKITQGTYEGQRNLSFDNEKFISIERRILQKFQVSFKFKIINLKKCIKKRNY